MTREEHDALTNALRRYSDSRKKRLLTDSKLPMKCLVFRAVYITACILVDGLLLPWIVIELRRTFLSYLIFILCLSAIVLAQVRLYSKIGATWKKSAELGK